MEFCKGCTDILFILLYIHTDICTEMAR